jgi:hypothetical protein
MSQSKPILSTFTKLGLAGALVVIIVLLVLWQQRGENQNTSTTPDRFASLDLDDPVASFEMLRYVAERGGDEFQRKLAIEWLSEQARLRLAPKPEQEAWILSMIENGGHPDWDIETRLWLFNDAFSYLHLGKDHEALTANLLELALEHPHKTMRLYALQHIELQREIGNLVEPVADKAYTTLKRLAYEPDGEVAGAALVALTTWDGPDTPPSKELIDLAIELAKSSECKDDIRVTAIHAVGSHTLELARTLAVDTTQPVQVRKASIACIGKFGVPSDTEILQQLVTENFRIAQAAKPALKAINDRESNKSPQAIPF